MNAIQAYEAAYRLNFDGSSECPHRVAHEAGIKAVLALTPTDAQPKAARPVGDEALRMALDQCRAELASIHFAGCDMEHAEKHSVGLRMANALLPALRTIVPPPTTGQETVARSAERFLSDPDVKAQIRENAAEMRALKETVATPRDDGVREALKQPHKRQLGPNPFNKAISLEQQMLQLVSNYRQGYSDCFSHDILIAWTEDFISALSAPGSAGPGAASIGWKLVPIEPTPEMLDIFAGTNLAHLPRSKRDAEYKAYANMLAATPSPAQEPGTGDTGEAPEWAYRAVDAYWTHQGEPLSGRLSKDQRRRMALAVHAAILTTPATTAETRGPADQTKGGL